MYPGYPPSYKVIPKVGDYHRTCFVIDVLSLDKLSNAQRSAIQERMECCLEQIKLSMQDLEQIRIIGPDKFDPLVRAGLRV